MNTKAPNSNKQCDRVWRKSALLHDHSCVKASLSSCAVPGIREHRGEWKKALVPMTATLRALQEDEWQARDNPQLPS